MKNFKRIIASSVAIIMALSVQTLSVFAASAANVKSQLDFSVIGNGQSIGNVTLDLDLPIEYNGAQIIWKSSDENLISIEGQTGVVKRPPFGEGYAGVLLTAGIVVGDDYGEKKFIVSIAEEDIGYKYSNEIIAALNNLRNDFLSRQNITAIKNNLFLPQVPEGMVLTMYSDEPEVIDNDGKVIRRIETDATANVYLNLAYGYESIKSSFPVRIKAYDDAEIAELFNEDKSWLDTQMSAYTSAALIGNITLPSTAPNGTEIIWNNGSSNAINSSGVITRQDTDVTATLTATLKLQSNTATAHYNVTVKRKAPVQENTGGATPVQGGGTSGGGGFSGGSASSPASGENKNFFADIDKTHWAYPAIQSLFEKGILAGYNGYVRPNDPVLREESVKMIVTALGIASNRNISNPFTDVSSSAWYYDYVLTAYENGIVNGIGNSLFGTGNNITRQDFAVIIYGAVKNEINVQKIDTASFTDDTQISEYAREAVYAMKNLKFINGRPDGTFAPGDFISRAEAAQIIFNILNRV